MVADTAEALGACRQRAIRENERSERLRGERARERESKRAREQERREQESEARVIRCRSIVQEGRWANGREGDQAIDRVAERSRGQSEG